jgi:hypothetical protein
VDIVVVVDIILRTLGADVRSIEGGFLHDRAVFSGIYGLEENAEHESARMHTNPEREFICCYS